MEQRIYRVEDYSAYGVTRALISIPRHLLTSEKTQRLLAMINNLYNLEVLPEFFKSLKIAFSLQLFFSEVFWNLNLQPVLRKEELLVLHLDSPKYLNYK
jgi:hypothetical protein